MNETMGDQQEGNQLKETDLAWLAGMFNGDGCFSLKFRVRSGTIKCDLSLTLTQCDPSVIERAVNILDDLGINPGISEYEPSGAGIHTKYNVRISRMAHISRVIDAILPFMVGNKSAQAGLMKRYIDRRIEYSDPAKRKANAVQDDKEALRIAKQFYHVKRQELPAEVDAVLNDYPTRSTGKRPEARGTA